MKGIPESRRYGITDNLADAAPAEKTGEGKEYRNNGTLFPAARFHKECVDIV